MHRIFIHRIRKKHPSRSSFWWLVVWSIPCERCNKCICMYSDRSTFTAMYGAKWPPLDRCRERRINFKCHTRIIKLMGNYQTCFCGDPSLTYDSWQHAFFSTVNFFIFSNNVQIRYKINETGFLISYYHSVLFLPHKASGCNSNLLRHARMIHVKASDAWRWRHARHGRSQVKAQCELSLLIDDGWYVMKFTARAYLSNGTCRRSYKDKSVSCSVSFSLPLATSF